MFCYTQQLRALIRQARKDIKPEKPGEAVRHGRAYRDIFQIVRAQLMERDGTPAPQEAGPSGSVS